MLMSKKAFFSIALLLPLSAFASSVHLGDYFLKGAEKAPDDIYMMGRTATFVGSVTGDVTSLSRSIFSESEISGDALFLGEDIKVLGPIGDDIRTVGERIVIDGAVADDVVAIGSHITIGPKATIKGSLYVIGGTVDIQGSVEGNARVLSGKMTLSGSVEGDLELWGTAKFAEPARIGGDFIQHKEGKITPPVNVIITGKVIVDESVGGGRHSGTAFFSGLFSLNVLMMLALAFALFLLARERTEEMLLEVMSHFWIRTLRGLLIVIILPLVFVLLLPTVVGIPFALILGALFVMLLVLSWGYAGILLGAWCERLLFKRSAFPLSYRPILLGTLFLAIISLVPFLGLVFNGILILSIVGSLGTLFMKFLRARG